MGQRRIAAMGLVARGPTEANLLAAVAAGAARGVRADKNVGKDNEQ